MKTRGLTSSLVWLTLLFMGLIALSVLLFQYRTQLGIFEAKELARLSAISNTLALSLDGNELEALKARYPDKDDVKLNEDDSSYFRIREKLLGAMKANDLSTTIYTMSRDDEQGDFYFLVSTSDTPFWKHTYMEFPEVLVEKYDTGGTIPPYEDENGTWLSAFAPVKNSAGQTVALLQIDEKFDTFIMDARAMILRNLFAVLVILSIIAAFMIYILQSIGRGRERVEKERMELEIFRKELIANVSHDLRTPLASIQGYLETVMLKKDQLDKEKLYRYVDISLSSAQKLRKLIDELFDLSLLESRQTASRSEQFNIAELLMDVATHSKETAALKGIEVKLDVAEALPYVYAEIALIERVLQNIIGNSIKYCESGNEVRISGMPAGNEVEIGITDNGPGIGREDLPYIFDRFRRANPNKPGSGLGLAIVKSILDLHEAAYSLESEPGKGTTFRFRLKTSAQK